MGGAIGAFFITLVEGIADAIGQRKSVAEIDVSLNLINSGNATKEDYHRVIFKFHEENNGAALVKYISKYRTECDDDDILTDFFEGKGLFLSGAYEQAKPLLEKVQNIWKESKIPQMEEVQVLMWLAIIHRRSGNMTMANQLRDDAIVKDGKYGTRIGIKSLPW